MSMILTSQCGTQSKQLLKSKLSFSSQPNLPKKQCLSLLTYSFYELSNASFKETN